MYCSIADVLVASIQTPVVISYWKGWKNCCIAMHWSEIMHQLGLWLAELRTFLSCQSSEWINGRAKKFHINNSVYQWALQIEPHWVCHFTSISSVPQKLCRGAKLHLHVSILFMLMLKRASWKLVQNLLSHWLSSSLHINNIKAHNSKY